MDSEQSDTATLRCRLLGHNYAEIRDFTQCDPGYFKPMRHCRRCNYEEDIIDGCVRDDAKWAAHQIEVLMDDE